MPNNNVNVGAKNFSPRPHQSLADSPKNGVRVGFIGDIVGKLGRALVATHAQALKSHFSLDFLIANGENSAGGFGITAAIARELAEIGIDCITLGNHTWDRKEFIKEIDGVPNILRPANFPPGTPGRGSLWVERNGYTLGVLNLMGRVYMDALDHPMRIADEEVARLRERSPLVFVDLHGEATGEKAAIAHYLDGRVSAVIGTHTHVQTADERLLPAGTAFLTDVGMTGPYESIIGMKIACVMERTKTQLPLRFEVEEQGPGILSGAILELCSQTGRALAIERLMYIA